jgi:phage tail-like protein
MADPGDVQAPPFTGFNFLVEIQVPEVSTKVCNAAFAECDGLEMNSQVKTIREGGNNLRQIHLTGTVGYAQLTLRRGMTDNLDLWQWFRKVHAAGGRHLRADATVVMLAADGVTEQLRFGLTRCLPVKIKAPALNAKEGLLAVEEMTLAYETLDFETP